MIDLGEQFNLSNKLGHPSNESKIVYKHVKKEQSETFVELLVDAGIDLKFRLMKKMRRSRHTLGSCAGMKRK